MPHLKNNMFARAFALSTLFVLICVVRCNPPPDPIVCSSGNTDCTITNSYGTFPDRSICRVADVAYPTTEQELMTLVAAATKAKRKTKVATRFSHSIPKLVCPDGEDGLLISTKYLNRTLKINKSTAEMTVESGVTLRQLIDEAAEAGLALPYSPYWWGLTIGGLLSTGAHGSSLWGKGSSVHEYVVSMKIVSPGGPEEGYVKVRTIGEDNNRELNAVKVSLGVLGVISQVTLKLQPMFKRSITYLTTNDSDLGDQAVVFGNQHEFADMNWYPSQRKVVYRIDDRVPSNTDGNALYEATAFRSQPSAGLALVRAAEEVHESTGDADGKCIDAGVITLALRKTAYGLTNNGFLLTGYPAIGFQNRIQSSGTCLDSHRDGLITACAWDRRIKGEYFHQTTFTIGLSNVKDFIKDVQHLIELEPKSMCGTELYNGILMRYVKASSAYLGKQEDSLDFDFTYYRSKDPMAPRMFEGILEEVEQMAVFKYGALPHWGKNRNVAFEGAINKYKNAHEFLKIKEEYDPSGIFSNQWTDQVLGLKDGLSVDKEGCALEGLCICSKDIHCAPSKGYICQSGRVYKDARVCSRPSSIYKKGSSQKGQWHDLETEDNLETGYGLSL